MDINEFLQSCTGNWFSQRSSYHVAQQQGMSHKSELAIEWLSLDDPEVAKRCQTHQIDPHTCLGGQKVSWDTSIDWGNPKDVGSSLLIFVPDEADSATGSLLSERASCQGRYQLSDRASCQGRYQLKADQSLYLILDDEKQAIVERIWFASPNLRLRTSLIKNEQGLSLTSFYSEIRKLVADAKA